MTVHAQAVLQALLADPSTELYGLEIADRTGLLPGTAYPILTRLQDAGWIESRWEDIDPHDEHRPRRRYYRLTATGVDAAQAALHKARAVLSPAPREWGTAAIRLTPGRS